MSAKQVKSLSFNGAPNRKHRDHRANKTRKKGYVGMSLKRARREIKRQEYEPLYKAKLDELKRVFNADSKLRRKHLSIAKDRHEDTN